MSAAPLLSVITACLNQRGYIAECVESVLQQGYAPLEHIILDGGSTDGTLEILRQYPHLKVVSQADSGIYDAWNRGLRQARGEVIAILNGDDLFAPGLFAAVLPRFAANPSLEGVVGAAEFFRGQGNARHVMWTYPAIQPASLWERVTLGSPVSNAWFLRRSLYRRIGEYDARWRWAGDREFFIRLALAGLQFEALEQVACRYRMHPGSASMDPSARQVTRVWEENLSILEQYLQSDAVPPEKKFSLRRAHSFQAAEIVFLHARRLRFSEARPIIQRALQQEPRWWSLALNLGLQKISSRLGIGARS